MKFPNQDLLMASRQGAIARSGVGMYYNDDAELHQVRRVLPLTSCATVSISMMTIAAAAAASAAAALPLPWL